MSNENRPANSDTQRDGVKVLSRLVVLGKG